MSAEGDSTKGEVQEDLSWRPAELLGPKPGWTLPALVRRQATRFGNAPFMSFKDGRGFTFSEYEAQGEQLALRLAALGIGAGDRVFVMLKNRLEFMTVCLAVSRLNAVFVPVNTELRGLSLAHQFSDCKPKMAIVEPEHVDAFADTAAPQWAYVATLVMGEVPASMPAAFSVGDVLPADAVINGQRVAPRACLVDPLPSDIACIMYTSGTTGPPKGVLMPHAHIVLFAVPAPGLGLSERDTYYVCLPLFHANALFTQVMAALMCGTRVHCTERFSASRWLQEVRDCGATVTNLLGVTSELVLKVLPEQCDTQLKAMMMVPLNEPIAREFQQRMKVRIFQAFGMTECNVATHTDVDDPVMSGLAGRPRTDYFDVIIGHPLTDEPMPVGEVGEILIRPKEANAFMAGYLNQPQATADAWRNLWFHTGDAGLMDEQGRIHFADRLKDRIRRRGENISAFEIEAALTAHPCIAEAAAVGIVADDASGEQEVKAVIVLHDGVTAPDMLDVYRHCEKKLPRFSVPRFYEFVQALPKTASNKVQRAVLRAAGVTATTWDRDVVVGRGGKPQAASNDTQDDKQKARA